MRNVFGKFPVQVNAGVVYRGNIGAKRLAIN